MVKQKSKLMKPGSEGCIFIPELPCNKKTKRKRRKTKRKKRKSKLLFGNIPSSETKMAKVILKKSKNYKEWCLLWDDDCQSKSYQKLKQVSEVEKCFTEKKKKIPKKTASFKLLHGDYIGTTSTNHYVKIFNASLVKDFNRFKREFYKLMLDMKSLFMGLVELHRLGICHNDIKLENVIYKDNVLYYIDFGLSLFFKTSRVILSRMKKEYNNGRIYESYPFEYIYYPKLTEEELQQEQYDILNKDHRVNHKICEYIHEKVFGRDLADIRTKLLINKKYNKNTPKLTGLVEKIDVYSLGVFPIMVLIEACDINVIDFEQIADFLRHEEFNPIMTLLYDMTEHDYRDRISAEEAYRRYINLISLFD